MPLKKSAGNMYDWVTHTHSHLAGECPHKCAYCYVQKNRFGVSPLYQGKPRLIEHELHINYRRGRTIFIEHMNDLFAEQIPSEWIYRIFKHMDRFPDNYYVLQTKNPGRAASWITEKTGIIAGTTIESNREYPKLSKSPPPISRAAGVMRIQAEKTFVTIEPILDFDVEIMLFWIKEISPTFVNIGADSKGCGLPEPPTEKIMELIAKLQEAKINIKKKNNLARLLI